MRNTIGRAFAPGLLVSLATIAAVPALAATPAAAVREPAPELLDLLARAGRDFSARRFASAAELYRRASAIDPLDGQPLVMAGVAAYQGQAADRARRDLRRALDRELSPEDRALALTYLGLIADDLGPPAAGEGQAAAEPTRPPGAVAEAEAAAEPTWSPSLVTALGAGYDSNARQAQRGVLEAVDPSGAPAARSLFASAGIELGCAFTIDPRTEVELGLGVEQSVYPDRTLADLDFQAHTFDLAVSHRWRPDLPLRLLASSELSFSGAGTALRPFQSALRLEPQLVLGAGLARLRLTGAWLLATTHEPELAHLSGHRLEATLAPILSHAGWLASLTGRVRRHALGEERTAPAEVDPLCPACSTTVVSHSHDALGASLLLSSPYRWRLRPSAWGRWELRIYDQGRGAAGPAAVELRDTRLRRDEHLAFGAGLALRLDRRFTVSLRHERSAFTSTSTPAAAAQGCTAEACALAQRRGYRKQAFTLDLTVDWL